MVSSSSSVAAGAGHGLISVTIYEGKGLSAGLFGRKDPFVVGQVGNQEFHTTAIHNGGKNPRWDQTFSLTIEPTADGTIPNLHLVIWDKDHLTPNDLMGKGVLDLSLLHRVGTIDADVPIHKRKNPAGTVRVMVRMQLPPAGLAVENMGQQIAVSPNGSYSRPGAPPATTPATYAVNSFQQRSNVPLPPVDAIYPQPAVQNTGAPWDA